MTLTEINCALLQIGAEIKECVPVIKKYDH